MKTLNVLIVVFLVVSPLRSAAQSTTVYQNDFSGTVIPSFEQFTGGGYLNWSVTGGLDPIPGNQCARFDYNIASSPSNTHTIWYGGFSAQVTSASTLPSLWQLSFDVSLRSLEPVMVRLLFVPSTWPPSTTGTTHTYWLQPPALGWQSMVTDQNTSYLTSTVQTMDPEGVNLQVFLSSQGPSGAPLSISQIGTYDFRLDNVMIQSVPEPCALSLFSIAGLVFLARRYRNQGRQGSRLGTLRANPKPCDAKE